ncbi:MAG: NAD(P)-dependent oxidoreductase [Candidatus Omnitrophica bacterium]|nr:NAD(P)-dependent oxidoreductase [Candidatus Omnitrophota bacterium]
MERLSSPVKKVGITGASGNIGTTLQMRFCKEYDLSLYDIKEGNRACNANFVKVDLAEKNKINGIFNGLDALIHLAADPRPDAPEQLTYRNNFTVTKFVFEEAHRAGIKKIIFASSNFYHEQAITQKLNGTMKGLITLDMPPSPACLYGKSKVFGEKLGRHFSRLGMQFVALRIGWTVPEDNPTVYGGDYMRAVFCSKRDLGEAFSKALEVETNFLAAFAVSNNSHTVFDLTETKEKLGFFPQDDAENYYKASK